MRKANLSAEKQSQIVSAAMSRYEYEPLRDAMLTAIPRLALCEEVFPYIENSQERILPKWWPRMKRTRESTCSRKMRLPMTSLRQEAAAMLTIARQRRTEVDRARQFLR